MNRQRDMKRTAALVSVLLAAGLWASEAAAWRSANRFGGGTEHTWGQTGHENRWGGSTEHVAGEGTEHTNAWGGDTAHAYGGGTEHTNVYGGTTAGRYGEGAYHTYPGGATAYRPPGVPPPPPAVYHPPVAVPYYSTGCYGCAAAAGAVVGMATGAAIASANTAAATSNAYAAGIATGSASTAAATTNAYNAGVAAGAAGAAPAGGYTMGGSYAQLPSGCIRPSVAGATYYLCGNTWFKPVYGANGVYYQVVPTP